MSVGSSRLVKTSVRIQGTGVIGAVLLLFHSASAADLPDLAPVSLQVPELLFGPPNLEVTLVWGVTNRGTGAAEREWLDEV